ncbi:hypothetical protein ACQEVC_01810 [Plantactinospora sp. CA-294935]|uniref:hypothetical protein n=1 Tax=Plantactinospora sp. CA-294935 TaxID=3240012 RepID=UPI003D91526A
MRFVRLIAGILLLTIGLPVLLVGGALWTLSQQRSGDGAFVATLDRIETGGHAVVVPDLAAMLRRDVPFLDVGRTGLRVVARTGAEPAFLGLAPTAEVSTYLANSPHVRLARVSVTRGSLPVRVDPAVEPATAAAPALPGDQGLWIRRGLGTLELTADDVRAPRLSLVVMRPDAGAGVVTDLRAEVRPGWLDPVAWSSLAVGGLLVLCGVVLLARPVRPREVVFVVEPSQVPVLAARFGIATLDEVGASSEDQVGASSERPAGAPERRADLPGRAEGPPDRPVGLPTQPGNLPGRAGLGEPAPLAGPIGAPMREPAASPTSAASTRGGSTDVASTDVVPAGAASTGVASAGVVPAGVASADVASADVVPADVVPAGVASTGMVPGRVVPSGRRVPSSRPATLADVLTPAGGTGAVRSGPGPSARLFWPPLNPAAGASTGAVPVPAAEGAVPATAGSPGSPGAVRPPDVGSTGSVAAVRSARAPAPAPAPAPVPAPPPAPVPAPSPTPPLPAPAPPMPAPPRPVPVPAADVTPGPTGAPTAARTAGAASVDESTAAAASSAQDGPVRQIPLRPATPGTAAYDAGQPRTGRGALNRPRGYEPATRSAAMDAPAARHSGNAAFGYPDVPGQEEEPAGRGGDIRRPSPGPRPR